jgi:hypothetical protein
MGEKAKVKVYVHKEFRRYSYAHKKREQKTMVLMCLQVIVTIRPEQQTYPRSLPFAAALSLVASLSLSSPLSLFLSSPLSLSLVAALSQAGHFLLICRYRETTGTLQQFPKREKKRFFSLSRFIPTVGYIRTGTQRQNYNPSLLPK